MIKPADKKRIKLTPNDPRRFDAAWKSLIKQYVRHFFKFFFPRIYKAIDFSKGVEFLDKELNRIIPSSVMRDTQVDLLMKVFLKNGGAGIVVLFIHLEIQGDPAIPFLKRLFEYYYRIYDQRKNDDCQIITVALLLDEKRHIKNNIFTTGMLGFELNMKVPVVSLFDFRDDPKMRRKLETSKSLMTMVVYAMLKSYELRKADGVVKKDMICELIRLCRSRGYTKVQIHHLLSFFEQVIRVPKELEPVLYQELFPAEENNMAYVPITIRIGNKLAKQEGRKEGISIGEKKGKMTGRQEGIVIGEKKGKLAGKKESAREIAVKMLMRGMDASTVSEFTGLKKREVESLLSQPITVSPDHGANP